ncbi:ParA family protein [Streptomyces sp. P5_D11]
MAAEVTIVGALKGGVSKTRLSMMAALVLARRGAKVRVIDGDSISQTSFAWAREAKKAGRELPFEVVRNPYTDIDERIEEEAEDVDHLICDIGGGDKAVFEAAISRAHRLLVPIGADPSEIKMLGATWRSATDGVKLARHPVQAWVVLTRTDHTTSLPREARKELTTGEKFGQTYPLADAEMRRRVEYQRVFGFAPTSFGPYPDIEPILTEVGLITKTRKH